MRINSSNFEWLAPFCMALIDAVKEGNDFVIINSKSKFNVPRNVKSFLYSLGCKFEKNNSPSSSISTQYIVHLNNATADLNLVNLKWLIMISGAISAYIAKPKDFITIDYYYDEMTDFVRDFLTQMDCRIEEKNSEYTGKLEYLIYLPETN